MPTALYPGTFDPPTNGHFDIIERAAGLFDRVIVTVALNSSKKFLFSIEERLAMLEEVIGSFGEDLSSRVEIARFNGLLVDFAREQNASVIVRGLRTLGDFEYEMQMALMNRRLASQINTVFIAADERYIHLNSTIVRDLARHGAPLDELVPASVAQRLVARFSESG